MKQYNVSPGRYNLSTLTITINSKQLIMVVAQLRATLYNQYYLGIFPNLGVEGGLTENQLPN